MIAKDGFVFVIRTVSLELQSLAPEAKGFQWPAIGKVECPDWNPQAECGGGLHGLAWGDGDWSLIRTPAGAKWQVVKVAASDIVEIDAKKVKFPRGEVIYTGDMANAMALVVADRWHIEATVKAILADQKAVKGIGYSSRAASSGNYSRAASSGDCSRAASSGDSSRAASSGNSSTAASSGNSSRAASSGNSSRAASSGNYSRAASSGNYSRAASSGNYSRAEGRGERNIVMASGIGCTVSAGENGCFATAWYDREHGRNRITVGYVGRRGIKANVPYRLDATGKYVEVA